MMLLTFQCQPMERFAVVVFILVFSLVGCASPQLSKTGHHKQTGKASYYGKRFQGKPTASGEPFDQHALTAAHKTLSFGSICRVTNLANNKQVEVRINDRGPFVKGRIIDLSYAAAKRLDGIKVGVITVKISCQKGR